MYMKGDKDCLSGEENRCLSFFERRVLEFIRQYKLVETGDLVLAAVSGGADSVCLLLVLKSLERFLGIRVEAVTVNHGIRGESAKEDVDFVRRLCCERGIPVHVCNVNVPELVRREQLSEEEAARKARYQCFAQVAEKAGARAIAVAHHRDDNCETILHHLFRGSSLRGLSGMAPVRSMQGLNIIRPFLMAGRQEIEEWLRGHDIPWRTDETNLQDDYTRNRIRHHVIPLVENEINERASVHVVQAGAFIAEAQALVEELAVHWLDQYGSLEAQSGRNFSGKSDEGLEDEENISMVLRLPVEAFQSCRPIVRREILVMACQRVKKNPALKDMGYVHLEMLERLADGETSRRVELPGGIQVKKQYGLLIFQRRTDDGKKRLLGENLVRKEQGVQEDNACPHPASKAILPDGKIILIQNPELAKGISFKIFSYNGEKIPENNYTKWFDYDKIKNGLSLRTRQPGDYFLLDHGGKKKLKSYMIDRKIPADQRETVLLLAEGSHVLWISDGRISAAYKVRRDTHNVLELYMEEEKLS